MTAGGVVLTPGFPFLLTEPFPGRLGGHSPESVALLGESGARLVLGPGGGHEFMGRGIEPQIGL